ncbi:MAG TPA: pentapeptide repeat-containing protein, partial [Nitrospira sp.]|nr:pentapeptide repeat-containing protein [Nitrospira sp.]
GNGKTTFNVLMVASGYSILTILITTDDRLLRNVSASPLPFIGTEAPVLWFYVLMPLVITSLYIFLISSISRLWNTIQQLPAIFPDGSDLTTLPYCWVLTDVARQAMPRLRARSRNPRIAQHSLQCFLFFSFPIFALLMFWWYYIPLRNETVTWLHVLLITLCFGATVIFFCGSIWSRTLPRITRGSGASSMDRQQRRRFALPRQMVLPSASLAVGVGLTTVVYFISFYAFSENADRMALAPGESCPANLSLQLLCQMNHKSYVDVRYKTLSSRPANWDDPANMEGIVWEKEDDAAMIRRLFDPVDGVDLRGFDLGYADAQNTFLAKARLEEAILVSADLKFADLRFAHLDRVQARGAYLSHADLRRARLIRADLEGAFLDEADLRGALLQAAKLSGACLRGANLAGAQLTGAVFEGADVSGALLGTNDSITKEQLDAACADSPVELPKRLAGQTLRKCPPPDEDPPCR